MKAKIKKNNKQNAASLKIFNDPGRARVLWHDAKTFPSAALIYLENILSGVYGSIPIKLKGPLNQLQEAAFFHLMLLENNSILHKIELKKLNLKPQLCDISSIFSHAEHFLKPLLEKNELKLKVNFSKNATLLLDERYGPTLIHNMLILGLKLGLSDLKNIFITISSKSIELEVPTNFKEKEINSRLDPQEIYSQKGEGFSLTALLFFVNQQLALGMKKKFSVVLKNKKLMLHYG